MSLPDQQEARGGIELAEVGGLWIACERLDGEQVK